MTLRLDHRVGGSILEVDHLRYLGEVGYCRRVLTTMRRVGRRGRKAGILYIQHTDGCCELESWLATAGRINDALAADGGNGSWIAVAPRIRKEAS